MSDVSPVALPWPFKGVPVLRVRRWYTEADQLRSHLGMTHRQYTADIKAIRKSKHAPARTVKEQLSEMHQLLHADIQEGHPGHGTVPHAHVVV